MAGCYDYDYEIFGSLYSNRSIAYSTINEMGPLASFAVYLQGPKMTVSVRQNLPGKWLNLLTECSFFSYQRRKILCVEDENRFVPSKNVNCFNTHL